MKFFNEPSDCCKRGDEINHEDDDGDDGKDDGGSGEWC